MEKIFFNKTIITPTLVTNIRVMTLAPTSDARKNGNTTENSTVHSATFTGLIEDSNTQ